MKLKDDFDEINRSKTFAIAATVSIAAIVFIIVLVLFLNSDLIKRKVKNSETASYVSSFSDSLAGNKSESETSVSSSGNQITVSDLDFYDLYKDKEDASSVSLDTENITVEEEKAKDDPATDGKHTLITYQDGTTEWASISPNITKNNYVFENLINQSGKMKYFEDNKCVSTFGVDISKEQDYIDFNKLKKAGVDFVMIRVASRGYQSGQINEDDYFKDNLKRASDAGLEVGVYFISSAITEDEAVEEANYLISMVGTYKLTYPVAYILEYAKNDVSRIDALSKTEKTMITRAFLNTIKEEGLKPIVYGTKEWFIKEVELSKLVGDYDFWLSNTGSDTPDYPYKFSMWQYNTQGSVDGIVGTVNLNISFVDYTLK